MSGTATMPFGDTIQAALGTSDAEWLVALREAGAERFAEVGLPGSRDEEWRFTSLAALSRSDFSTPGASSSVTMDDLAGYIFDVASPRVVLVDGRFVADLSNLTDLPAGVTVMPLATAIAEGLAGVEPHLGRTAGPTQTPFTALSAATFSDGLFFKVSRGVKSTQAIEFISVTTAGAGAALLSPRVLVVVEESAEASLVESYLSLGGGGYLTNAVVEIQLEANARLEHSRVQREDETAWNIGFTQVDQQRDSHYRSFALAMGGRLARHNLHARHHGENVETLLYGLYLTSGEQLADTHSAVFHDQPNCNSWEVYKGILADNSRGVFNGKVFVDPIAQKTDAKQTNRNLLLSDTARVDTKPQLEIFADDVRCTHGATIGQLNPMQRYYLQTRGIGGKKAEKLLTWAFAAEVLAEVQQPRVRERLEELVHGRLDELTG